MIIITINNNSTARLKKTRHPVVFKNSFGMILFQHMFSFLALIALINCSIFSSRQNSRGEKNLHLVLNSTGFATEFCLFNVEKLETQNFECKAEKPKEYPKCVEYFTDNVNYAATSPKETLDQIYKGLADLELVRPQLKKKIQSVGYIATGTFNIGKDGEAKQTLKEVENYFTSEKLKITTKLVNAEEEIKLTVKAIQIAKEIPRQDKEIAVLQIGSDSLEVLTERDAKVATSKIGIQLILEELSNIKPGINACRQPISSFFKSEASSFEKCKEFISENLSKQNRLAPITKLKLDDSYKVFTTGATWNYFYPNKNEVTMDELNQTGREFCSLTIDQILKKGIKKKYAYNLCYSLSFKAVVAEALAIKKMQILQKEIYLKNLSTSPTLFPEFCK